jgi:chromatin structure-remodeling complex subunit RSC9
LDEPERSTKWLRTCFEEDKDRDITQISLWQAYQSRFQMHSANNMLAAADFIKNVSTTFPSANAQVTPGDPPRFIIKGIRPKFAPTDSQGRPYTRCHWKAPGEIKDCGKYYMGPKQMGKHIACQHVGLAVGNNGAISPEDTAGLYPNTDEGWKSDDVIEGADGISRKRFNCYFNGCQKWKQCVPHGTDLWSAFRAHLFMHLPDDKGRTSGNDPRIGKPATYLTLDFYDTAVDERGEAAGLPLVSLLVLRNLARNVPKAVIILEDSEEMKRKAEGRGGWMEWVFTPKVKNEIWRSYNVNRALQEKAWDLWCTIEKNEKWESGYERT